MPYGFNPFVNISGTTTNPILNLSLVQGPQGIQGITPNIKIGTITLIYYNDNSPATVILDPLSTITNPIFNFALKQGYKDRSEIL